MATAMIQVMPGARLYALAIAQMPMIGAIRPRRSNSTITVWICCMSLVQRVMSDAVENWLNSCSENCSTLLKSASRIVIVNAVAMREAR